MSREHIERIERLASVGEATTEIMHELNNNLTVVLGYAVILYEQAGETSNRAYLKALMVSCDQCCRLAKEILSFARGGHSCRTMKDLGRILIKTIDIKRKMFEEADIEMRVALPEERMEALVNEFQLQQVVLNILHNAHHELLKVTRRTLEIRGRKESDRAVIMFCDSGRGIRDEHRERIFEPFFSTKPEGEGTGLGLSISRRIMEEHGGSLRAEGGNGGGATFILELPIAQKERYALRPGIVYGPI